MSEINSQNWVSVNSKTVSETYTRLESTIYTALTKKQLKTIMPVINNFDLISERFDNDIKRNKYSGLTIHENIG